MKLKNSDLEALVSSPGYQKLFTTEFDDILLVLEIRRQNEELKPALKAYVDTKQELINRYCDKDSETGEPIQGPNGQFSFNQDPDGLKTFQEKFTELLGSDIEVNTEKIKIPSKAMNAVGKWSGADISSIYQFIDVFESDSRNAVRALKPVPGKEKPEV